MRALLKCGYSKIRDLPVEIADINTRKFNVVTNDRVINRRLLGSRGVSEGEQLFP